MIKSYSITAVVLTKNDKLRIETCLKSISWVDEIVIVDNSSTDETVHIAKKYTKIIVHTDKRDFSALRNIGNEKATGDFVLYVDTDEQVTNSLRKEIEDVIRSFSSDSPVGYYITRINYYLGKKWPKRDKMQRLFYRKALKGWRGVLHETADVDGSQTTLHEPLLHHTHRNLEEMLAKTNEWSRFEAELRLRIGHPKVTWWRVIRVMLTGFWRSYIGESGWKAGATGIIEAIFQAYSMFVTYAKLWEIQQHQDQTMPVSKAHSHSILFPVFWIVILWGVFSLPYTIKHTVPFPSDYLVSFFPPWNAYFGMPVKNNAMPDLITQLFPWKSLTVFTYKLGQIPLWNPYSFAGTVHAGNYQSAVFSPFNLLFLRPPFLDAWTWLIILQPLLAGIGMILLLQKLGRGTFGIIIGAVSFMFCGFLTTWMGYGTLSFAALWLPYCIFSLAQWFDTRKIWYAFATSLFVALSFLSGHFQISIYVTFATFLYAIFEGVKRRSIASVFVSVFWIACGMLFASPQIITTAEAYIHSNRTESFIAAAIPWKYAITIFAPDFFGNPVTRNDWFGQYAEWASFTGSIAILFAIIGIGTRNIFFTVLAFISFLSAFSTPINSLMYTLKVPILSTSNPTRIIVLFSFSVAVLASYGFDEITKKFTKRHIIISGIVAAALVILAALTRFGYIVPPDKIGISLRNLVIPTGLITSSFIMLVLGKFFPRIPKKALYTGILLCISFDMYRYVYKWMPKENPSLVYPAIPVISFLQKTIGNDRVYGTFGNELMTHFRLASIEGYDAMYQKRYAEFISSSTDGSIGNPERSVVLLNKNGEYSERILEILGVRYLLHRVSDGRFGWAYPFWKYDFYTQIYKDEKYEVYENSRALPRAFLASGYLVASSSSDIISSVLSKNTNLTESVILEEEPRVKPQEGGTAKVDIIRYTPNRVDFVALTDKPKLLFVSDVFDDGWEAFVDGKREKIHRADYAFRAVSVPSGRHSVTMIYNPSSVRIGFAISLTIVFMYSILILRARSKIS